MKTKRNKALSNPWVIGTGSSILAALGLSIIDKLANTKILSSIWSAIKWIFSLIVDFFQIKYQVSLWFLILLPILVIGLIVMIIWIISLIQEKTSPPKTSFSFFDYKEDQFGEVLYRWDYIKDFSDKYMVDSLTHFCPKCKCAIVNQRCPICQSSFYNKTKDHDEVIALISHQIELRSKLNK